MKVSSIGKPKSSKKFGEERFDYIRACKHEIKSQDQSSYNTCPFCKLVQNVTKSFFVLELERQRLSKETSNVNRALMRRKLLYEWSKCQSNLYVDVFPTENVDIFITKSMAVMLSNMSPQKVPMLQDFSDIVKLLQRKTRVVEVGHFAALFLQSRIRKFLAKIKMRRLLLVRFEYVPPTKRKKEFFVDTMKLQKWTRLPFLLRNEPPGSPRTITRRLATMDKKREQRMDRFLKMVEKHYDSDVDLLDQEDLHIARLRQFVIFRDIISVAMRRMCNNVNLKNSGSQAAAQLVSKGYRIVRISLTAPVASPRQLGIYMVINSNDKEISVSTASTVTGELLNNALQQLEERALAILRCDSPEAVLGKVLCGDIIPALTSVVNISEDDFGIWNAKMNTKSQELTTTNTSTNSDSTTSTSNTVEEIDVNYHSTNKNSVDEMKEVLPIALQLRPYWPDRKSNGLFRLFFFEEDLVSVTQYSPCVFYPEVLKNKDTIMHSIRTYATLPATKQFVKHYYSMANNSSSSNKSNLNPQSSSEVLKPVNPPASISRKPTRYPTPNKSNASAPTPLVAASSSQKYVSYFVPPEQVVFNLTTQDLSRVPLNAQTISDEVAVDIAGKYSFLSKVGDFAARLKRAQQNQRSRARRQTANNDSASTNKDVNEVETVNTVLKKDLIMDSRKDVKNNGNKLSGEMADLEGEGIHKLIKAMSEMTANSSSKGRKPPTDTTVMSSSSNSNNNAVSYTSLLQKYGCSGEVETEINARIQLPAALEAKTATDLAAAESSPSNENSSSPPTFKLLVLDVFVNLPKPSFKVAPTTARLDHSSHSSITSAGSSTTTSSSTVNLHSNNNDNQLYSIDMHEVVGIFNVDNERAPPNLDLGLADWNRFRLLATTQLHHLHKHRLLPAKTKGASSSASSSSSSSSGNNLNGRRATVTPPNTSSSSSSSSSSVASNSSMTTNVQDKSWSYDNVLTGIASYRAFLSSSGREFEFLILGTTPDRQQLERNLPKNIKKWLGLGAGN